jgi:hypothetical protein
MVKGLQTSNFIPVAIGACVLLPLIATAQTAQQDQSMTATASAPSKLHRIHGQGLRPLHGEGLLQYHGRDLRLQSTERSRGDQRIGELAKDLLQAVTEKGLFDKVLKE